MLASCATCCSSCSLGLQQHLPDARRGRQERVLALGPEDRGVLQRHPAVEDRLGVDRRRADPGRFDLEEHVRPAGPAPATALGPERPCRLLRRRRGRGRFPRSPARPRVVGAGRRRSDRTGTPAPSRASARRAQPAAWMAWMARGPARGCGGRFQTRGRSEREPRLGRTGGQRRALLRSGRRGTAGRRFGGAGGVRDARAHGRVLARFATPDTAWRRCPAARTRRYCRRRHAATRSVRATASRPICTISPSCTAITGAPACE